MPYPVGARLKFLDGVVLYQLQVPPAANRLDGSDAWSVMPGIAPTMPPATAAISLSVSSRIGLNEFVVIKTFHDQSCVDATRASAGEIWHIGRSCGQGGARRISFVARTWMSLVVLSLKRRASVTAARRSCKGMRSLA